MYVNLKRVANYHMDHVDGTYCEFGNVILFHINIYLQYLTQSRCKQQKGLLSNL